MHFRDALEARQTSTDVSSDNGGSTITSSTPTQTTNRAFASPSSKFSFTVSYRGSATAFASSPTTTSKATTQTISSPNRSNMIPILASVLGVLAIIFAIFLLRRARIKHRNPKYIPTPFLKKAWQNWNPRPSSYKLPNASESLEPISASTGRQTTNRSSMPPSSGAAAAAVEAATAGVDRNTSVRSVMTLPAYNQHAMHNEQVLGREGERGGIDVVIEFPENQDDEEARRDEEMEALYQVRLARRRENEEREERRRLRREARERGDHVALREIAARARAASGASGTQTIDDLRAEHERIKKERQRAVSSVSYGDLGVARHDGTRLRANSQDSERQGLLGDAASIAASSHYHRRDRSTSSIISIDTTGSAEPSPGFTRSRANSHVDSPRASQQTNRRPSASNEGRAGSSPEMVEHDDVPPNYENISLDTPSDHPSHTQTHPPLEPPPTYSSPTIGQGEPHPTIESSLPAPTTAADTSTIISPVSPMSPELRPMPESRRTSTHIGQLMDSRASSSSSLAGGSSVRDRSADRRSSRMGVGGAPQLPSLRLGGLPSIQVDPGSPMVGNLNARGIEATRKAESPERRE